MLRTVEQDMKLQCKSETTIYSSLFSASVWMPCHKDNCIFITCSQVHANSKQFVNNPAALKIHSDIPGSTKLLSWSKLVGLLILINCYTCLEMCITVQVVPPQHNQTASDVTGLGGTMWCRSKIFETGQGIEFTCVCTCPHLTHMWTLQIQKCTNITELYRYK